MVLAFYGQVVGRQWGRLAVVFVPLLAFSLHLFFGKKQLCFPGVVGSSFLSHARATHARILLPAALASVSYCIGDY